MRKYGVDFNHSGSYIVLNPSRCNWLPGSFASFRQVAFLFPFRTGKQEHTLILAQFLFAIVVLGVSVTLAKHQVYNSVPAATGYSAFTGGLGILAALVGFVALFASSLDGIVTWVLDGLASLAFLAGGLVCTP